MANNRFKNVKTTTGNKRSNLENKVDTLLGKISGITVKNSQFNSDIKQTNNTSSVKNISVNIKENEQRELKIDVDSSNAEKNINKLAKKVDTINTAFDRLKTTLAKLSSMKSGGNFDVSGLLKNLDSIGGSGNDSKIFNLIRGAVGNDKSDFNNNVVFGRLKGSLTKIKADTDTKVNEIIQYVDGIDNFLEKLDSDIKKTDTKKIDLNKTPKIDTLKRGSKNVTVNDIIKTFGVVDVTIANAVKKENKQQEALNKLYDNLLQLSETTGIATNKIGQGLSFNLTKIKGTPRGQSTKNRISLDAIRGWNDTTTSHEFAHSFLSNLAKRLHGAEAFKKMGSETAVNSLFDDNIFNQLKNNKNVSQTDINLAEMVRNIVSKAISEGEGNLFAKIDKNSNKTSNPDKYKKNSEVFARLFARGITGKTQNESFELDQATFNKLIAPQLTKLVAQMYGPDAQKRIKVTGSNAKTNQVIAIAKNRLKQNTEEKDKNAGLTHDDLSNARESFEDKIKSAVSDSNSFEQNIKSVFNSSLKHFEESFKNAINNIAEIFKNQISQPMKEISVSFGNIVTSLRQSGLISNNMTNDANNSLKNTVKKAINTEYEEAEDVPVVPDYQGKKTFAKPILAPGKGGNGVYSGIEGTTAMTQPNADELVANNRQVQAQNNWARQLATARRLEQQSIDMNMFGWVEEGTTQDSYTRELTNRYNQLKRLETMFKKLNDETNMKKVRQMLSVFENFKGASGDSLFKNGNIDLTPNVIYNTDAEGNKQIIGVQGIDAGDLKPLLTQIDNVIKTSLKEIDVDTKIKDKDKVVNDMFQRYLKVENVFDDLTKNLNQNKFNTTGEALLNKFITDNLQSTDSNLQARAKEYQQLLNKVNNQYGIIQNDIMTGVYDNQAGNFKTTFDYFKSDINKLNDIIKELFAQERARVNERQDNRVNAFNAASSAMDWRLYQIDSFIRKSGIDPNTVIDAQSGLSLADFRADIAQEISDFKLLDTLKLGRDELYQIIRDTQQAINKMFLDMKEGASNISNQMKNQAKIDKKLHTEDLQSKKEYNSIDDAMQKLNAWYGQQFTAGNENFTREDFYRNMLGNTADYMKIQQLYTALDARIASGEFKNDPQAFALALKEFTDAIRAFKENVSKAVNDFQNEIKQEDRNDKKFTLEMLNKDRLNDVNNQVNDFIASLNNQVDGLGYTRGDMFNKLDPTGNTLASIMLQQQNLINDINSGKFLNDKEGFAKALSELVNLITQANADIDKNISKDNLIQSESKKLENAIKDYERWLDKDEVINNEVFKKGDIWYTDKNGNLTTGRAKLTELQAALGQLSSIDATQYTDVELKQQIAVIRDIFSDIVKDVNAGVENIVTETKNQIQLTAKLERENLQILNRATNTVNKTESQINRALRNPTLNTLFADSGDPYLRGNVRLKLTENEDTEFKQINLFNDYLLNEMQRTIPGESLQDTVARRTMLEQQINQNEQSRIELRDRIANRIGRHVGRTYNEYQEVYNPMMQQFMQSTGFHIFKNPNERGVDWESLSNGFTSGNRIAFVSEIMKFINLPSLKDGLKSLLGDLKAFVVTGIGMIQSALSKLKPVLLAITGAIAGVTASVTAAITAFAAFGKNVISTTDEFRRNTLALTGVYRTPTRAHEMIQMAYKTSASMPMDYSAAMTTLNEISAIPAVQKILRSPDRNISQSMMDKMFKVITAMTTMRPDKTASDAVFSLRNAFAGDLRSLQRRFDLPVSAIPNVKNGIGLGSVKNDPMAMVDSLNNYFDTFLDMDVLNQVSRTVGVIVDKIKGSFDLFKANIGNSGIYDLILKDIDNIKNRFVGFVDSDYGREIAKRLSDALANSYEAIKGTAQKIGTSILGAFGFNTENIDIANVITTLAESFAKGLRYVESVISDINIEDYIKKIVDYISNIDISKIISFMKELGVSIKNVANDVIGFIQKLNNGRKSLGISNETLGKGLFYTWLFGPGNVFNLIKTSLHTILSSIMTVLGSIGSYITVQTAIFTAQGTAAAEAVKRAIISLGTTLKTALLPITLIAGEIYLLGNNFEVIGETAANVVSTITSLFENLGNIIDILILKYDKFIINSDLPDRFKQNTLNKYKVANFDLKSASEFNDLINSSWIGSNIKDIGKYASTIKKHKDRFVFNSTNGVYSYKVNQTGQNKLERGELLELIHFANYLTKKSDVMTKDEINTSIDTRIDNIAAKMLTSTLLKYDYNQKLYNPENKKWSLKPSGSFFGISLNDVKDFFGFDNEETKTETNNIKLLDGVKDIYSWLNGKMNPFITKITAFYKNYNPEKVLTDYSKAINKETNSLNTSIRSQKSQYSKGFNVSANTIFGGESDNIESIYFGPNRLNVMLTELDNVVKTVDQYTEAFNGIANVYATDKDLADVKEAIKNNQEAIKEYKNAIIHMLATSVMMIEDGIAQMDFSYVSKDIDKYVSAQSRAFDKKITSEVFNSIAQDYSSYFAIDGKISERLQDLIESHYGNVRGIVNDYRSGNIAQSDDKYSDMVLETFVNRLEKYINTLTPIIKEQARIKGTQANIGNMRLGELNTNWKTLLNDRSKAVRDSAGERYMALLNEGIEKDTLEKMATRIVEITTNSFADMRTLIANGIKQLITDVNSSMKNGLVKLATEGGTVKPIFKEMENTAKKTIAGVYAEKVANDFTGNLFKLMTGSDLNLPKTPEEAHRNTVESELNSIDMVNGEIFTLLEEKLTNIDTNIGVISDSNFIKKAISINSAVINGSTAALPENVVVDSSQVVPSIRGSKKDISTITALEYAESARATAEATNTIGKCARGWAENLAKFTGTNRALARVKFGLADSVNSTDVDAHDLYNKVQKNKNWVPVEIDWNKVTDYKSLSKQLQPGYDLFWSGRKNDGSIAEHVATYIGGGQLASDHIEKKDWYKWRLDSGYGRPIVYRLKSFENELSKMEPLPVKYDVSGKNDDYNSIIANAAKNNNLSAELLKAVIQRESSFNNNTWMYKTGGEHNSQAAGLMQFVVSTALEQGLTAYRYNPDKDKRTPAEFKKFLLENDDRFNPSKAIPAGAKYLKGQIDTFGGNVGLGLTAYNWGAGNVFKALRKSLDIDENTSRRDTLKILESRYGDLRLFDSVKFIQDHLENFGGGINGNEHSNYAKLIMEDSKNYKQLIKGNVQAIQKSASTIEELPELIIDSYKLEYPKMEPAKTMKIDTLPGTAKDWENVKFMLSFANTLVNGGNVLSKNQLNKNNIPVKFKFYNKYTDNYDVLDNIEGIYDMGSEGPEKFYKMDSANQRLYDVKKAQKGSEKFNNVMSAIDFNLDDILNELTDIVKYYNYSQYDSKFNQLKVAYNNGQISQRGFVAKNENYKNQYGVDIATYNQDFNRLKNEYDSKFKDIFDSVLNTVVDSNIVQDVTEFIGSYFDKLRLDSYLNPNKTGQIELKSMKGDFLDKYNYDERTDVKNMLSFAKSLFSGDIVSTTINSETNNKLDYTNSILKHINNILTSITNNSSISRSGYTDSNNVTKEFFDSFEPTNLSPEIENNVGDMKFELKLDNEKETNRFSDNKINGLDLDLSDSIKNQVAKKSKFVFRTNDSGNAFNRYFGGFMSTGNNAGNWFNNMLFGVGTKNDKGIMSGNNNGFMGIIGEAMSGAGSSIGGLGGILNIAGGLASGKGIPSAMASFLGSSANLTSPAGIVGTVLGSGAKLLMGGKIGGAVASKVTGALSSGLGSAILPIAAVAGVLSKKGWAGGPKDRTAEGKARGAEFTSLRTSLIANRNAMARNYYMANDDTLEALQNYEFGGIGQWDEKRGKWYKGTRRRITRTDATSFTQSMTGYWDLIQKADEEQRATQRTLNRLQNTNNMEYLRQTGMYEEKRKTSIQTDLAKYKEAVAKYAGLDTGFTQTLFDGKSYTLTELNDKVNDLIKELGDSSDAIAQNTEAIRQENLATESSRLDYITALYGDINPSIAQINNKQKLENEWNSIVNEDDSIGYVKDTKEYWDYMTRLTQAERDLKNQQKQQSIDLSTNWISDLRGIAMENGTYDNTQIKQLSKLYGKREDLKVQIQNAVDNMDSALAEKLYDESQAITEEIEHYKSSTSFSNSINDAIENMNNVFNNVTVKPINSLTDNVNSIMDVIKQSEQWIKDAGYSGYDELDSSVLLPLFQSSFGNVNEMSSIFTEGVKSGIFDTTQISPFKDYSNNLMTNLDSFKTDYRELYDSGATKQELNNLVKAYQETVLANVTGMNSEYEKMFKTYQQDITASSILSSMSGFEDYTIANDALKEFNDTLGAGAMEKLIGYGGDFNSESLGKFMNVSGLTGDSDPYEMYHEWEKKHIMQRIENSEEGSEEWYAAELDLWNLMADNAKYLKEKAEKTTSTIEEMLSKIEETARTRVTEEAKSAKGDIIFFDLGSSRDGTQFINNMLDGINANTPETQKLVKTLKQKLMGVRR